MDFWQAIVLGIVEGVTEFLPISSTGHLTIVESLMGMKTDSAGVTAFTAIIQVGAIVAAIVYFFRDIVRLAVAWARGLFNAEKRSHDYRMGWYVIIGTIPIGIIGFLLKDFIASGLRSLWVVVAGLLLWSIVMYVAERVARQDRGEEKMNLRDAIVIGFFQCIALIPGVSRSGATISAGLFRGLDRVSATRISFFLGIPALTAAGGYEALTQASAVSHTVGWLPTIVATIIAFITAYVAIAWLLRLVAHHPITVFIWYRVGLAVLVSILLVTGVVSAT